MLLALALFVFLTVAVAVLFAVTLDGETINPAAWLRAKRLFLSKLSEAERLRWAEDRRLTVVGSSGQRYTLLPYAAFNILTGEKAYCLRVLGRMPVYDKLLAQRLLVESDEQTYLALANCRKL